MDKRLEFGSAFSRVFELYGKHFVPLITYAAIFYGVIALLWAVVFTVFLTSTAAAIVVSLVGIAITVVASVLITGAYIVGLDEADRTGSFPSFGTVWPRVTPLLGALIITGLLSGLGVLGGLILLVIPGLILATWWFVASPVVMLENLSGVDALKRSRELVRGNGWTVFGLFIVVSLITGIAGGILGSIGEAIFGFNDFLELFAGEFIPGALTAPIGALLAVIVYRDLVGTTPGTGTDAQHLPPSGGAPQVPPSYAPPAAPQAPSYQPPSATPPPVPPTNPPTNPPTDPPHNPIQEH